MSEPSGDDGQASVAGAIATAPSCTQSSQGSSNGEQNEGSYANVNTGGWGEYTADDGRLYYYNEETGVSQWVRPAELGALPPTMPIPGSPQGFDPTVAAAMMFPMYSQGVVTGPVGFTPAAAVPGYAYAPYAGVDYNAYMAAMTAGSMSPMAGAVMPGGVGMGYVPSMIGPGPPIQLTSEGSGPEGCNLFVFHIPNDMTNLELYNHFNVFGNVCSTRIMVEKDTGRSRGFGFVSFTEPEAAQAAILAMDGYQLGRKRLKVQLKKPRDSTGSREQHDRQPNGRGGRQQQHHQGSRANRSRGAGRGGRGSGRQSTTTHGSNARTSSEQAVEANTNSNSNSSTNHSNNHNSNGEDCPE